MPLDVQQAATFLGVEKQKIERWLRQGVIPVRHVGGQLCFDKTQLASWADKINLPRTARRQVAPASEHPLVEALRLGGVHCGLKAGDRDGILREAVGRLALPETLDRARLAERLIAREEIVSTGTGGGVAMPHPQQSQPLPLDHPLVACFHLDQPLDYEALDNQPVFCLFMLLSKDATTHLKMLSALAHALKVPEFIEFLKEKPDLAELIARIEALR